MTIESPFLSLCPGQPPLPSKFATKHLVFLFPFKFSAVANYYIGSQIGSGTYISHSSVGLHCAMLLSRNRVDGFHL
jgi:hypothetical protein